MLKAYYIDLYLICTIAGFICECHSFVRCSNHFYVVLKLINPAKNELGRLSKFIIQAINKELRHKFNLNQWKNTEDVIDWFNSVNEKQLRKFAIFNIKDFYPTIKKSLLKQSLPSGHGCISETSHAASQRHLKEG